MSQITISLDSATEKALQKAAKTKDIKAAIQTAINFFVTPTKQSAEQKIAKDVSKALKEVKSGNTRPVSELLSEL